MITISYEELFTFENLYKAHLKSRCARRTKKPIVKFEIDMLSHLYDIYYKLNSGKFKFGRYHTFYVREPKLREIQNMKYADRIVQRTICDNMLAPYFSTKVIYDNCVCQKGKGLHFALERFEKMLRKQIDKFGVNCYFLKCDILKYFACIPHDNLKKKILPHFEDEKIKKLICDIIDGYHTKSDFLAKYGVEPLGAGERTKRGVPIGNQTSQIFGMYYLDTIDRLIKEKLRIKTYSRYMDDFVMAHPDLEYLKKVLNILHLACSDIGLALNAKTQIFPFKNGITYLGYHYKITENGKIIKTVKKTTKRRFRQKTSLLNKAYIEGLIDYKRLQQSSSSILGHLSHAKSVKFTRELKIKLDVDALNKKREEELKNNLQTFTEEMTNEREYQIYQ
ncbi:MAG: RNA-directed DNA polymerase [Clostridia bacterium]|nr:RNA-directed DNA polymerase [Clostridia bacterium]